ncbi:hypothetical protein LB438_08910 [Lactococcus lactis subsp. lactis]|uniref:hypothetical protein n=1 Tax=Lactococcus lactis TaxID=1358 RepID=UPI000A5AB6DE|nr:hypothetical protein [Lactococcus lactis]
MKRIKMRRFLQDKKYPALDFLKYVGPGLIVAVGFMIQEIGLPILLRLLNLVINYFG